MQSSDPHLAGVGEGAGTTNTDAKEKEENPPVIVVDAGIEATYDDDENAAYDEDAAFDEIVVDDTVVDEAARFACWCNGLCSAFSFI